MLNLLLLATISSVGRTCHVHKDMLTSNKVIHKHTLMKTNSGLSSDSCLKTFLIETN